MCENLDKQIKEKQKEIEILKLEKEIEKLKFQIEKIKKNGIDTNVNLGVIEKTATTFSFSTNDYIYPIFLT